MFVGTRELGRDSSYGQPKTSHDSWHCQDPALPFAAMILAFSFFLNSVGLRPGSSHSRHYRTIASR